MSAEPWQLTEEFEWEGHIVRWEARGFGPPVIMCHGTPWSSYVWRGVAEQLVDRNTVYVWDMLGYGLSDKPDGDVSLQAQARILTYLARHWDTGPAHVVAHDFGGAVALRAHLLHGVPFSSMLLADVVALRPWGTPFFRLVGENPEVFSGLPANLHRALVGAYIAGASYRPVSSEVHEALVTPWLGADGQPAFYRQIAQAEHAYTDEIEHLYSTVEIPTLIVWGEEDDWIPLDHAHRLNKLIKGSRLILVDAAGHLIQEDRPQLFPSIVAGWIDEQR